ncbi:hypothetical protein KXV81_007833 [Aspergillus fumigatus]|nr:hypothetical protein KXX38_007962 [Aspergillus fumigatus]KAH1431069.1 hypothetical protein KXX32_003469 [Aspergillus fumigatus]KAH1498933.1 hypothetical protein KXX52_000455 [Aspergillus fumigatus]KAH1561053.1 hypothetical protein KXX28_005939 [Aspergillus fumigatus]KAH1768651.1 hypothetical protein KXX62_003434 [Aspergillus fumigatus]
MTKRSLFFVLFNGIVSVAYAGVRFPQISRAVQGRANEACAVDPEGCLCTGFCPPLLTCCDNLCVDLQSNPDNCGACNNACPPENGICSDGACESLCMLPEIGCGFDCVDASSDPENCGGCDIADTPCLTPVRIDSALQRPPTVSVARVSSSACPRTWNATGPVLIRPPIPATAEIAVLCVLRMMPAATASAPMSRHATTLAGHAILWGCDKCPADWQCCDAVCQDVLNDPANCGGCGNVCEEGEVCTAGLCQEPACPPGQVECDGVCTDPNTDPNNCGACGTVCPEGEPCVDGVCQVEECPPGETDCDGTCVDTTTDPTNCGACGVACPEGTPCVNGACELEECPPGQTQCLGLCVDTTTDPLNCGGCGNACPLGQICTDSACGCLDDLTDCDGVCTDTDIDPLNCGACGNVVRLSLCV